MLAITFGAFWWIGVREAEYPPLEEYLGRVALGFVLGLGGLGLLFYILNFITPLQELWYIPATPPEFAISDSGAILVQFGVGMVEEGVFRVAVPRMLMTRNVRPTAAVVGTNWTFAMYHWSAYYGNVMMLLIAFLAGVFQSIAYFTSRTALGVMLGHTIWNINASGLLSGFLLYVIVALGLLGAYRYIQLKQRRGKT